jgi:predicted RNA-binding protein with TRAM domain
MYGENRRGGFRPRGGMDITPPVKVGDELDVKIEAVGEKGDGIAKKDNFVIFVPGVKEGDQVKIRVTKVLRKVGFAEVVGAGSAPKEEATEAAAEGAEEAPAEETEEASEEPSAEDSENFGEETEESAEPAAEEETQEENTE